MVTKKQRNTIGKFLVWGGLITLFLINGYLSLQHLTNINSAGIHTDITEVSYFGISFLYINLIAAIALLIGGLWGMRR